MDKANGEALALRKEIDRLTRRKDKISKEIYSKKASMQDVCIHNETEVKDSYVPGGYLDREQFIKTTVCIICGKEIKEDITYGGFN